MGSEGHDVMGNVFQAADRHLGRRLAEHSRTLASKALCSHVVVGCCTSWGVSWRVASAVTSSIMVGKCLVLNLTGVVECVCVFVCSHIRIASRCGWYQHAENAIYLLYEGLVLTI